jgi:hypothetical protein
MELRGFPVGEDARGDVARRPGAVDG